MDGTPRIDELLSRLEEKGGSDLHIKYGARPLARIDGEIVPIDDDAIGDFAMGAFIEQIIPEGMRDAVMRGEETECSYHAADLGRFRISAFHQRGELSMAIRRLSESIPQLDELRLPSAIETLAEQRRGLILVSGATGSGKSTTLASIIGLINARRREHIITIEDPIEYVHLDNRSVISQREIGSDTASFPEALRRALRQDPDVIAVGEMREPEAVATALRAADTGHLVLSTVHTNSAAETITRMMEFFPDSERALMRQMFVSSLLGIVSQRLLPEIGGGRVPAVEVLVTTPRISEMLRREGLPEDDITAAIAEGGIHGMQTFDQHLVELVQAGQVDEQIALAASSAPHDFGLKLKHSQREDRAETLDKMAESTKTRGLRTAPESSQDAA